MIFVAVSSGAAAFLLFFVLVERIFGRTPMQRRLATLKQYTAGDRRNDEPLLRRLQHAAGDVVEQSPGLTRLAGRSTDKLDQAGAQMRPTEWLVLRAGVAVTSAVALAALVHVVAGFVLGLLLGFLVPGILLNAKISRRRQRFADDLPALLQLILSALRSGFTLQQSVDAAVRDDEGPVAEEFARALSESRISGDFEDALERAGERLQSPELSWLTLALRLQKETGGSLSEVLQTTAETMRERAYLRRHVRSLSAEGRISAYVLVALPIFATGLLFLTRREYMQVLWQTALGLVILGVALLMVIVGSLWLRSVTKIEV
ncbi:type II secretion system F family protein [Paractinoplanes hotanensis]|uniref:Type II secretion system F family protein n=1 Tax=Paractinoplanes hotanensis TaxID=2906497 RepID=A0ABT0XVN2_9ACTN|nr:type II secretion system F family protein [Actinoplanes hotanensis]MCM4077857.1 type II secretion system F family protein [Actinoplanes hotanensis]